MRLQLSIHRNTLPPVQIIFTTGTGPASHTKSRSNATIADLLHDVNDLVPLESSDGEWGLEDYIVEVAATADQEALYECLHFQTIDSVFRDDDEVTIRALGGEELRSRRLGGRLQITSDGTHLIDGVVWGRRWIRKQERPGILIPPRKKRRMLLADEEDSTLQLEHEPLRTIMDAEDNEDSQDGDFEDKENINYEKAVAVREEFDDADKEESDDQDEEEDLDTEEILLLLKDAEELDDVNGMAESENIVERQLKTKTRLGKRKREPDADEEADAIFEGFSTPVKSSRSVHIDLHEDEDESSSEAESESESNTDSMLNELSAKSADKVEKNILFSEQDDESDDTYYSQLDESSSDDEEIADSSFEPGPASLWPTTQTQQLSETSGAPLSQKKIPENSFKVSSTKPAKTYPKKNRAPLIEQDNSRSESPETGSEDTALSKSSSLSESDLTSSSGSDPTSKSDSGSSSSSESESEATSPKKTPQAAAAGFASKLENLQATSSALQAVTAETPLRSDQISQQSKQSAPGQGKLSTHKKNEREKLKTRLRRLKEAGELPAHAGFSDLKDYENQGLAQSSAIDLETDLEAARARLLNSIQDPASSMASNNMASLNAAFSVEDTGNIVQEAVICKLPVEVNPPTESTADRPADQRVEGTIISGTIPEPTTAEKVSNPIIEETPHAKGESAGIKRESPSSRPESASKRAKLDVAASRRLLFGSLGLRTPKTPAEEQALRDKLAKDIRPDKVDRAKSEPDKAAASKEVAGESWQDKLIISAVECEREGVTLPPPPFPFEQNWHKKRRTQPADIILDYDGGEGSVSPPGENGGHAKANGFSRDVPTVGTQVQEDWLSNAESRTISFEKESDGMPIPTNFDALTVLDRSNLLPGTTVAYKEVYVGAETNFQPQISTYRVARITSVDDEGLIAVVLSKKDRTKRIVYDGVTGEEIANDFEIHSSQDGEDNGVRELDFAFMLDPKLVEASLVQVPESGTTLVLRGGDCPASSQQRSDAMVPESLEDVPDISQPKKIVIEQVEIDTPRRKEITTIIKEAGFESAMDEQLLEPLQAQDHQSPASSQPHMESEQEPDINHSNLGPQPPGEDDAGPLFHEDLGPTFSDDQGQLPLDSPKQPYMDTSKVTVRTGKDGGWSSSPLFPAEAEVSEAQVNGETQASIQDLGLTSSPPISPQLTVDYPHMSQLELGSAGPRFDESTRHSSHQDAQRLPSVPPSDLDLTFSPRPQRAEASSEVNGLQDDDILESLQSEVPQSQSQDAVAEQDEEVTATSFLGRAGCDGHESSYHESDDDPETASDSDSSLPSLRELTSSQKRKITTSTTKTKRISPPPLRRQSLRNSKPRKGCTPSSDSAEPDLVTSSDPLIKMSGSQCDQPRSFSQIPMSTEVVDLTLSSDLVSPDYSDREYGVMRPRRAKRAGNVNGASKLKPRVSTFKASVSDMGIGTKRFLTTKKTRSQDLRSSARDQGYF